MEPNAILEAAMMLPEDERLALVFRLMDSLPSEDITMSVDDPAIQTELDRRYADRDGGIPWFELRAEE